MQWAMMPSSGTEGSREGRSRDMAEKKIQPKRPETNEPAAGARKADKAEKTSARKLGKPSARKLGKPSARHMHGGGV
jgi:hypothetical protein